MYRVVIFANKGCLLESWRPWLEQNYEVTFISSDEALTPLIQSWRPHILIYFEKKIRADFIQFISQQSKESDLHLGLVIVAPQYDLREELLAFHLKADHYVLASTPTQSINARIQSLAQKNEELRNLIPSENMILLPQKTENLFYKDLALFPDQNLVRYLDQHIKITPTQFRLLTALLNNMDKVLTREWLQIYVFKGTHISPRSIDAQMAKLKHAIPMLKTEIVNIYGQGYLLRSPKSKAS